MPREPVAAPDNLPKQALRQVAFGLKSVRVLVVLYSGCRSCVHNVAMAKTFRPYEPDQLLLLSPSLADWVPEDHLARFVSDVVDLLDLPANEDTYDEERGYPPYHPCMMVTCRHNRIAHSGAPPSRTR
jgi:hypothetical protein